LLTYTYETATKWENAEILLAGRRGSSSITTMANAGRSYLKSRIEVGKLGTCLQWTIVGVCAEFAKVDC
jgi:hypothetical protein